MDDKLNPRAMEGFIGNGIHVLHTVKGIPKVMFQKCAGMLLLSTSENAFFLSKGKGAGVVMSHNKDKGSWSAPIAVCVEGSGLGLVIGHTDKDTIVFLNSLSMQKVLDSNGGIRIGADLGFAVGKIGRETGAGFGGGGSGGFSMSSVYTFSDGIFLGTEINGCAIDYVLPVNQDFYGTSDSKAILDGTAKIPDGDELVSKLHAAIKNHE